MRLAGWFVIDTTNVILDNSGITTGVIVHNGAGDNSVTLTNEWAAADTVYCAIPMHPIAASGLAAAGVSRPDATHVRVTSGHEAGGGLVSAGGLLRDLLVQLPAGDVGDARVLGDAADRAPLAPHHDDLHPEPELDAASPGLLCQVSPDSRGKLPGVFQCGNYVALRALSGGGGRRGRVGASVAGAGLASGSS